MVDDHNYGLVPFRSSGTGITKLLELDNSEKKQWYWEEATEYVS